MRLAYVGSMALAFVIGGLATAAVQAHGGNTNAVHACVGPAGYLRVVAPDETCHGKEQPLDWSIVGPAGPAGQDGVNGVDGQDGIDGKDGADGQDGQDGVDGQNGANGTNGANGQDGVDGQDGANGVSGYEIVTKTAEWGGGGINRWMYLECPAGKRALGAGFDPGLRASLEVHQSNPSAGGTQWTFDIWGNFTGSNLEATGYVICATVD